MKCKILNCKRRGAECGMLCIKVHDKTAIAFQWLNITSHLDCQIELTFLRYCQIGKFKPMNGVRLLQLRLADGIKASKIIPSTGSCQNGQLYRCIETYGSGRVLYKE